ncbi:hypothetical protein FRC11_013857 [Ceratobasidium sp. 423]|nr:hypothetical protein FRC11_013857 [Ceratobasidium sp. 423]
MAPKKTPLPVVLEHGHITSRGKLHFSAPKKQPSTPLGVAPAKWVPSVTKVAHNVKRMHIFSPAAPIAMEVIHSLDNIQPLTQDEDGWEDLELLDHYMLFASQAKVSSQRYYHILEHLTSSLFPMNIQNRYREFMHCCRQWIDLMDLKRSGVLLTNSFKLDQGVKLGPKCPACPYPGINYTLQQVPANDLCKDNTYDADDTCLSDGHKYFVEQAPYKAYLAVHGKSRPIQHQKPDCNEMKAVTQQYVKFKGLDITGMAAVACRHEFFTHGGSADFHGGEHGLMFLVIGQQQRQGHKMHGITYDIFCQWYPHFEERLESYGHHINVTLPLEGVVGGIPKFHLASHKQECYVWYSLNNMAGFGHLDGEVLEWIWAALNEIAGSACEKGPGARLDQLSHIQGDWNWVKLIFLGRFAYPINFWAQCLAVVHLQQCYWVAKKSWNDTKESWNQLNKLVSHDVTSLWDNLDTQPVLGPDGWTSVFVSTKSQELLGDIESQEGNEGASQLSTNTEQVLEGIIKMEHTEHFLELEEQHLGSKPTASQSEQLNKSHVKLAQDKQDLIPGYLTLLGGNEAEHMSIIAPATSKIILSPSKLPSQSASLFPGLPNLKACEAVIRQGHCLNALKEVRMACLVKALLLKGKKINPGGQKSKTRAQTLLNAQTKRIQTAMWQYDSACLAYQSLSGNQPATPAFPALLDNQVSKAISLLHGDEQVLGQGQWVLPWFFMPPYCTDWAVGDGIESSEGK